jgi:hypothetical protein
VQDGGAQCVHPAADQVEVPSGEIRVHHKTHHNQALQHFLARSIVFICQPGSMCETQDRNGS